MTDAPAAPEGVLRAHAEDEFAHELAALAQVDDRPRRPQWRLSPWAGAPTRRGGAPRGPRHA